MSKIFIGKKSQKEKDFNKILEHINKRQKEMIEKLTNKFNSFDSEKRKYKLKMLGILYSTYLSTLGTLEEKDFSMEELNLIKSLEEDNNKNNNFIPVINQFQNLQNGNLDSIKDLYESNMLRMEKKKSDLKNNLENKNKEKLDEKFKTDNCIFCTEEFEENGIVNPQIMECKKYVHGKCFLDYIKEELNNNRFPIRCPLCPGNEKHEINYKTIIDCLLLNDRNNLAIKLENISLNYLAQNNSDEITFCKTPGCSYMCFYGKCEFHLKCPLCKKEYCLQCKTEWHTNLTCEEYQKQKKDDENEKQFELYLKGSRAKQCPNCKKWVEKISGCDHITCSCGSEFCYLCGELYINGHHYCKLYNAGGGLFGNINYNIAFGNNQPLFGSNANNQNINQNFNLFSLNNNNNSNNLFGNNNNQQTSLFGNNMNNQNYNLFGNFYNTQQGNLFNNNNIQNNNNNNQNLFGNNNNLNTGININNQNNNNIFGINNNNNSNSYNNDDQMFLE